jgi:hypothetical protein
MRAATARSVAAATGPPSQHCPVATPEGGGGPVSGLHGGRWSAARGPLQAAMGGGGGCCSS